MKVLASIVLALTAAGPAAACTRDEPACGVPMGDYRVALPDVEGPIPAVIFLHGAGGTGRGTLGMTGTVKAITDRGYAVIAPDGLPWRSDRSGGIWSFRMDVVRETPRDEAAFFDEVVADAAQRHDVDPDNVILAGFSAGAFMVTSLACDAPESFAAYAPVSGGFWRPHPDSCDGPVRLFQTHGWTDGTVPLEGRPLGNGRYLQGDILEGLSLFRDANGCARPDASGKRTTGDFLRRYWTCDDGTALEFALFPGGHGVPAGWADMMLDWFEGLPES
ncbi:alpha/beta hydrolase family esterase [Jannaschia donghaensis]|uniref:Esterase, PHB depolymerase family n=1 Tax=Jannaschia donghaensis TaxID=420998 RepID=A0A0M6YLD4_9RHOB|nr:PHB depolymerase family esterase [Jannaschia donghaensis]CTQ50639.1 esterase, PHB depolymerase family [Jannaschia donghaensis]